MRNEWGNNIWQGCFLLAKGPHVPGKGIEMKRFLVFVPITALAVIVFLSAHLVSAGPIVPKDIGADAEVDPVLCTRERAVSVKG